MIKYIAFYDTNDSKVKRNYPLSAANKLSYIFKSLSQKGVSVNVISCSNTAESKGCKRETRKIYDNITLTTLHGFRRGNKLINKFSTLFFYVQFMFYLFFHLHKKDTVIVYHSLFYYKLIRFLKRLKRFKLILEIEEIYYDVNVNKKKKKTELSFFQYADAYIFPTQLLDAKINIDHKPSVIVHGTYNVEKDYGEKFNDGRVHCVYAGTFDPRKGGVAAAAAAAQFLNEKYHVHIIGFGSEKDEKLLINQIDEISQKTKCKITFDGLKSGEEYIRFIQKCDIGLSTQNPDAAFNDTSFPSKILSYMANGLRVVSVRIPAVEQSAVGQYIYYYDEQKPEKIAEAIMKVDLNDDYDSRKIIKILDKEFKDNIRNL